MGGRSRASVGATALERSSRVFWGVRGSAGEDEHVELAGQQRERVHGEVQERALHVTRTTLENVSKSLLRLSVQRPQLLSKHPAHHNRTTRTCDAYPVRIPVRRSPVRWPDISDFISAALSPQRCTHDPAMFPSCENPLMSDKHTARFDGGRGNELFIHAYITTNPAYDCAMRNLSQCGFSVLSPRLNTCPSYRDT